MHASRVRRVAHLTLINNGHRALDASTASSHCLRRLNLRRRFGARLHLRELPPGRVLLMVPIRSESEQARMKVRIAPRHTRSPVTDRA